MEKNYDIVIIGGGPAGISAGIYASRAGRSVLIIEKYAPGGQLSLIGQIENYAGFKSINGYELAVKFEEHAKSLGIEFCIDEVVNITKSRGDFLIKTLQTKICAKSVVLALGCHSRPLNIEGEEELKGKGVSYCALCDGNFFKNKTVAVVGSGDSAFSDAIYLSSLCKQVYVLTKNNLKLHNYSEDELDDKTNVQILKGAISKKILGKDYVQKLIFEKDGIMTNIDVDGVFVAIGRVPDTKFLKDFIELTDGGYIKSNDQMETSQAGVFVCGDVREGSIRQIATAVGDGAIAGTNASKYALKRSITNQKKEQVL